MPKVILKALDCTETESWPRKDKCRLEITVDGNEPIEIRRQMNNGDKWVLERSYIFEHEIRIKLWDEDWPDPDDFLGEVKIGRVVPS